VSASSRGAAGEGTSDVGEFRRDRAVLLNRLDYPYRGLYWPTTIILSQI